MIGQKCSDKEQNEWLLMSYCGKMLVKQITVDDSDDPENVLLEQIALI